MSTRWRGRAPLKREHPGVASRKTVAYIEAMAGREIPELRENMPALPKKRSPRTALDIDAIHRKRDSRPLERNVLKAVVKALRADPRVARVQRNTSGVFQEGGRIIRVGSRGLLDLTIFLKSGAYAEIEIKRPGGKPEPHQAERIATIRASGGIAGYATSAEEALALLP